VIYLVLFLPNRRDWRTVSVDDVNFNPSELIRQLVPMLRFDAIKKWGAPVQNNNTA